MTQADERLKALFAQDAPPARDPAFSMAVMERVMRRRFQEEVAMLCGLSLIGAVVLWPLWPVIQAALVVLSKGFAPAFGALALALCVLVMIGGRSRAAVSLS